MKFRIKFQNKTCQVILNDDDNMTLGRLKDESASVLERELGFLPRSFELSLNGKDILEEIDKPLSHFGIVGGDLLYIMSNEEIRLISPQPLVSPSSVKTSVSESTPMTDMLLENNSINTSSYHSFTTQAESEISSEMIEDDDIDESLINKYLSMPMLCRDSTKTRVPESLQQLYFHTDVQNNSDALCIAFHVLMLETGFRAGNFISTTEAVSITDPATQSLTTSMPGDWRQMGMYVFQYNHPSCLSLSCSVMCVPLAKQIMVHGSIDEGKCSSDVQLLLKPEDYVKSTFHKDAAQVYSNLPKLSRLFKDAIAYPLLVNMQNTAGLLPQYGLIGLSLDVKLYILSFLNARSLLNLTQVCKEFNLLAKESILWKHMYFRDFRGKCHNNTVDWFQLYKTNYLEQKRLKDVRRQMRFVPPQHFPPVPFTPPFYPDMIGGDYDLHPAFAIDPNPFAPAFPNIQPPNLIRPPRPRFDPFGQGIQPSRPPRHPFMSDFSSFGSFL